MMPLSTRMCSPSSTRTPSLSEVLPYIDSLWKGVRGDMHASAIACLEQFDDRRGQDDYVVFTEDRKAEMIEPLAARMFTKMSADGSGFPKVYVGHPLVQERVLSGATRAVDHWFARFLPLPHTPPAANEGLAASRRLARPPPPHPPRTLCHGPGFGKGPPRSRRKKR